MMYFDKEKKSNTNFFLFSIFIERLSQQTCHVTPRQEGGGQTLENVTMSIKEANRLSVMKHVDKKLPQILEITAYHLDDHIAGLLSAMLSFRKRLIISVMFLLP